MTRSTRNNHYSGYSMVEMLVMVGLLITLMTMLMPIIEKSQNSAKYAVCTNNLHQIYIGNQTLSVSEGRPITFPEAYNWQTEVESILKNSSDLMCPMADINNFKSYDQFEFLPAPPPSIANKQLESDDKIFVFREKENFELTEDLDAIVDPGFYGNPNRGAAIMSFEPTGAIPAGTEVDVFYFHYDGISEDNAGKILRMVFGARVFGFIGRGEDLDATDELLGVPSVQYTPQKWRGVDASNKATGDAVRLPSKMAYIDYTTSKTVVNPADGTDGMRVITDVGGGSNYGMNLEVPKHPQGRLIFLADSNLPVIDFDGEGEDATFDQAIDPRHEGKVNIVFTDGSVELMDPANVQPHTSFWRK